MKLVLISVTPCYEVQLRDARNGRAQLYRIGIQIPLHILVLRFELLWL